MKKGTGCKVGGVAARRVTVVVTPNGPAIDAVLALVDPATGAQIAMTRKTREWPDSVRTKLVEFLESIEEIAASSIFTSADKESEKTIAESLKEMEGEL